MFLSISWIRTYLRKKWNCSFQRTVKKSDKLDKYCSNPYSLKFEVATCDRPSFANEPEKISAIKLLSINLLTFYKNMQLKSENIVANKVAVSDTVRNLTSVSVEAIKVKCGRKVISSCKLKKDRKCLRRIIKRNKIKIYKLENQVSGKNVTDDECSDTNDTSEIVSGLLLKAYEHAGVSKNNNYSRHQLSIEAGVIIRSLHSDCNVSFSKMSLTIHLCLALLFGTIN